MHADTVKLNIGDKINVDFNTDEDAQLKIDVGVELQTEVDLNDFILQGDNVNEDTTPKDMMLWPRLLEYSVIEQVEQDGMENVVTGGFELWIKLTLNLLKQCLRIKPSP